MYLKLMHHNLLKGGFMQKFLMFLFYLILISGVGLQVFGVEIKGVVTDSQTDEPLGGVNVYIEGTNIGAVTDKDGYFTMAYDGTELFTLHINYVGYKSVSMELNPSDDLSALEIAMNEDIFQSETIVVTGIASRTSKDVAEVAVSRVPTADYLEATAYQDLSQLVAGKVSGVQLAPSSGNVGGGFRFFMRSGGGLNGNEQPVIYIDGVRVDDSEVLGYGVGGQGMSVLSSLNPEDIENIEVLKGPAGAATYGTNGSNGVVLITTKTGKRARGEPKAISINYRFLSGINAQSYEYSEDDYVSAKDANGLFRDGNITQHSLSATGGTNYVKYFTSFDRRNEEGILHGNWMDRKTVRANIDAFPTEKVSLQLASNFSFTEMARPWNDNNIYGPLGNTLLWPTSFSYTDSASLRALSDMHNINRFIGSARITYAPFKNFEAQIGVGIDNSDWRQDQTFPQNRPYMLVNNGRRSIWNRQNQQFTYDLNIRYSYDIMEGLKANSVLGSQLFDRKAQTSYVQAEGFDTELITDVGAGADFTDKGESKTHLRDAGIFFETSLSYIDQYYLTLGIRRDYASSVGTEAPSINYPKASFAVRLDRYDFMPSLLNLFKLRLAYGESGQLPDERDAIPYLWAAQTGGYGAGAVIDQIGNAEIEPERIKEFEVGFESEFFTNYALEFTYYRQYASNSIVGREESPSTGLTASSIPYNIGSMESSGFESLLQATPIRTKNYELSMNLIWNYQKNEVTDLGGAQPIFDGFDVNVIKEDLPKHEFYTFKVKGALFDDNGVYIGTDVTDERVAFGNPIPEQTGSFSINFRFLKNFNFYALMDWAIGNKVFNYSAQFPTRLGNNPEFNKLANQLDLAAASNVAGLIPVDTTIVRLTPGTAAYESAANEFAKLDWRWDGNYVEDGDFFKLREISISYSFADLLDKIPSYKLVDDIILGFSARNIWTSTKYSGPDPEVNFAGSRDRSRGIDFLTLQNPRVYNFWLRIAL